MANIKKMVGKNGHTSFKITVYLGRDNSGKNLRQTTTFSPDQTLTPAKQQKEAERFAMDFEQRFQNGQVLTGEKITVEQYTLQWLDEAKNRLTPGTYTNYKSFLEKRFIPALGYMKLSSLKAKHLKDFLHSLKGSRGQDLNPTTIRRYLTILKSVFTTAWKDEILCENPTERVSAPRQEKIADTIKYFTPEQTKIFLGLLDNGLTYSYGERTRKTTDGESYRVNAYTSTHQIPLQYKIFFNISIFGGLRRGEVLGITWNDIDFVENIISVNKSISYADHKVFAKAPKNRSSIRTVRLPASLMESIKQYRKEWVRYKLQLGSAWEGEDDFLFIQENGKVLHPSTPYHKFKEILVNYNSTVTDEKKKLPMITLHDLRHTSASLLLTNNIDLMTVSKRLGHSKKSTTLDIYAHILEDVDKTASDKMESLFFTKEA